MSKIIINNEYTITTQSDQTSFGCFLLHHCTNFVSGCACPEFGDCGRCRKVTPEEINNKVKFILGDEYVR